MGVAIARTQGDPIVVLSGLPRTRRRGAQRGPATQSLLRRTLPIAALAASLTLVSTVAGATGPVVTVTQMVAGLNDVVAGGFEPPDVTVAAGPGFVVEMVNLAESVWRTGSGTPQLVQTRDLAVLFGSNRDRLTDPRVLYDAKSGRWFASISDVDSKDILLAVSTGADPTGTWTVSAFDASACADQPRLGIADDIVVLTADLFDDCDARGARVLGSEVWTVNKAQLVAGSVTPAFSAFGPTPEYTSVAPVQSLSPTATEYAVSVDDRVSRVVHLLAIDGVPPLPVTVREIATPTISLLARPPAAAQPQTGGLRPPIATNDNRILDSVWENGKLWFSANARCVPAGDSIIRTCGRVVELATATRSVTWDTDIGVAGAHVFFPAVRPDSDGNLVIVAGESGVKVLPEVIAVGRTPDGALTEPVVVAQSAGIYRGDRYGDYFGAARDPLDPRTVWVGGEAGTDVPSGSGWATTVASVVVTAAGADAARGRGHRAAGRAGRRGRRPRWRPSASRISRARRRQRGPHARGRARREEGDRLSGEHRTQDAPLRSALLHAVAGEEGARHASRSA